jgi:hypothetical protein
MQSQLADSTAYKVRNISSNEPKHSTHVGLEFLKGMGVSVGLKRFLAGLGERGCVCLNKLDLSFFFFFSFLVMAQPVVRAPPPSNRPCAQSVHLVHLWCLERGARRNCMVLAGGGDRCGHQRD